MSRMGGRARRRTPGRKVTPRVRDGQVQRKHPRDVGAPFEVAFQGLVQVAALYGTAVLSSQLVVELNRARAASVAERRELAALRAEVERLRAENERIRVAMRRCLTCDYRLEVVGRD